MRKRVFLFLASCLLSLFPTKVEAQTDNFIASGSTSPYLVLGRGLVWGGQGLGTVGQNFIFHPVDPNQGFCVFVFNNNPSNSHSFSITVAQTGDPAIQTYQGNTSHWVAVPTTQTFPISVLNNSLLGVNYKTTASAGIVISFTGNATAAGSPDTADIFTVQTSQSSCGAIPSNTVQGPTLQGQTQTSTSQFPVQIGGVTSPGTTSTVEPFAVGSTGPGGFLMDSNTCCQLLSNSPVSQSTFGEVKSIHAGAVQSPAQYNSISTVGLGVRGLYGGGVKVNFLEWTSDINQITASGVLGWVAMGKVTNPAANGVIFEHFNLLGATNMAYKTLILSCSAACEMIVNQIAARGTTCTALTPQNLQIGNNNVQATPNANDITENACGTPPTLGHAMYDIPLAAGQTITIDLTGFVNFHNAAGSGGFVVETAGAITGVATASLSWVEE